MFDLGISKLAIVGFVAVLVIGPEKLPGVARTAGTLLGRLQRYVNGLKAEISQVAELDELRRMRQEMQQATSSFERNLHSMAAEVRHDLGVAKMFNSHLLHQVANCTRARIGAPGALPLRSGTKHVSACAPAHYRALHGWRGTALKNRYPSQPYAKPRPYGCPLLV
jgi:Tat protein translocase TatB subunit